MLNLLTKHAGFSINLTASGDLPHHIIEDIAIVLGQAFNQALGDKIGIERFGSADIPMDESLATCVVDLSGRSYAKLDLKLDSNLVENMASEDFIHFFETFATNAKMNLHLWLHYGTNMHHKVEAAFKALAHALHKATRITSTHLLSTKGTL
jgi:imidazoleglycerol-phosphate dehydratase